MLLNAARRIISRLLYELSTQYTFKFHLVVGSQLNIDFFHTDKH